MANAKADVRVTVANAKADDGQPWLTPKRLIGQPWLTPRRLIGQPWLTPKRLIGQPWLTPKRLIGDCLLIEQSEGFSFSSRSRAAAPIISTRRARYGVDRNCHRLVSHQPAAGDDAPTAVASWKLASATV